MRRTKSLIEPAAVCEMRQALFDREQQLRTAAKAERAFAIDARLANDALFAQRERHKHSMNCNTVGGLELKGAA
jgi:hypothetical protein